MRSQSVQSLVSWILGVWKPFNWMIIPRKKVAITCLAVHKFGRVGNIGRISFKAPDVWGDSL